MASTDSLASWHPAFRPNSHSIDTSTPSEPSAINVNNAPDDTIPSETSFEELTKEDVASQHVDAWFSEDANADDDNWLSEPQAPTQEVVESLVPPAAEPEAPTGPESRLIKPEESEVQATTPFAGEPASGTDVSKDPIVDKSNQEDPAEVSAAFEVETKPSTQVDWDDGNPGVDGEADWFLSRSESNDPFKFMPPSDRSNSFPTVQPIDPPTAAPEEPSLPRTQVEDLLQEEQEEDEGEAFFANADAANEDSAATRYEEGLPLIAQTSPQGITRTDAENPARTDDVFADEEDDFFSNVVQSGGNDGSPSPSEPWPLDRKSTLQAMGQRSASSAQVPSLDPTSEALEVEEQSSSSPQEESPHLGQQDKAQPSAADSSPAAVEEELNASAEKASGNDALEAKWSEAFADDELLDDDFLVEDGATESKEMDPSAFFGSDDEGFLDDAENEEPDTGVIPQSVAVPSPTTISSVQNRYAPQVPPASNSLQNSLANPYAPAVAPNPYNPAPVIPPPAGYSATAPPQTTPYGAVPQPPPSLPKAQSFADKAKGGYTSPYDLPMNVVDVKPRKRPSMQQLPSSSGSPPIGPPRSASMYAKSPTGPPPPGTGLPALTGAVAPSPLEKTPSIPPKTKESFFEDLPVTSRPRPSSRQSHTSSPAPMGPPTGPPTGLPPAARASSMSAAPPLAPPSMYAPVQPDMPSAAHGAGLVTPERVNPYAPPPAVAAADSAGIGNLVKPATVNPYAHMPSQSHSAPPVPAANNRYSPNPNQPPHVNGAPPPAATTNRYSPSPAGSRQPSTNYAAPPPAAHTTTILPHQPRTSSPLAHFEITANRTGPNGEIVHADRRTSLPHDHRIHRVPSLPPMREAEEEQEQGPPKSSHSVVAASASIAESRYSPVTVPGPRSTPPPLQPNPAQTTLSPPKRSPYTPISAQPHTAKEHDVAPPSRSFSQSPNSQRLSMNGPAPHESPRRAASAQAPVSPKSTQPAAPAYAPTHRARAPSLAMNMVPPTDGREHDPLQRWKGVPILVWGVGGTMVSMFPKSVPRYGISQTAPMIVRAPGEVKVKHVKDILPLEERLSKFPGPLKGKSKKKETLAWLSAGIDSLSTEVPDLTFSQNPSHEEKRSVERLLLWKILRVFIEHDGVLEGSATVQKAVRDILMPGLEEEATNNASPSAAPAVGSLHQAGAGTVQADAVDPAAMETIRKHLLVGDRENAAWAAVDKRLWGHAMLIANTVSPDLYKQVAQEFVRKEVNYPGHTNESIAALYKVLSGNHDECVDELVPVHARAGLQLMAATTTGTSATNALGGLDKWRETLCLILGNRSSEDIRALSALGDLLASYGRAEAAHICFIFAKHASVFGGIDDPRSNFVLIGSDHRGQADRFFKDAEALLLSEVYEYGLSLAGTATPFAPHLAGYKLQLATTLAEYGQRDRALQYCEGILISIGSQTKRSPYHHPILEQAVEDFIKRLKQAPKEESNSWIPKPSMNKVSDTMWSTFNKFVSGDDNDGSRNGVNGDEGAESGPFAKIAGGTPTISRSPSVSNFESYNTNHAGYPVSHVPPSMQGPNLVTAPPQPSSRTASRYAPLPQQGAAPAAVNPYEPVSTYTPRSSSEGTRHVNPYEPSRPSTGYQPQTQQQYTPTPASQQGYQPSPAVPAPQPTAAEGPSYPLAPPVESSAYSNQTSIPPSSSYIPLGLSESSNKPGPAQEPPEDNLAGDNQAQQGYQAPSYGYEPPSFTPVAVDEATDPTTEGKVIEQPASTGGYEPPSYQSYGYEPPSYDPPSQSNAEEEEGESSPKPKRTGPMYDDDDDDVPALKPGEKSKAEKDRENEEMVRRVAEEEAKRAAEKAAAKKGWGFGSWFGGGKKEAMPTEQSNKPIRANLGEQSSFVYDPELKRWVNKKAGAEATEAKKATPPPPKGPPRSASSTPPPRMAGTPPPPSNLGSIGRSSAPPGGPPRPGTATGVGESTLSPSHDGLGIPTPMTRSVSNQSAAGPPSGPPSRPTTSMSNASSIDDLIGAAAPRKPGQKKARKSGRYVDVMAK
ncbi:hypothetical protein jhhlp_002495 [Lomentospora prolificans]|uniref:Protein transport protein sec16 n=1 Tax=Lomentospora prolificans TaxID=41688 RepID=A0A2N3NE76_9PEZI|nr:hypothetical protein jhhlp_002495 [Lomentospora prolificans]